MKLKRRHSGFYTFEEWNFYKTENYDGPPEVGYEWNVTHPDHGDEFFRTLKEARAWVAKKINQEK